MELPVKHLGFYTVVKTWGKRSYAYLEIDGIYLVYIMQDSNKHPEPLVFAFDNPEDAYELLVDHEVVDKPKSLVKPDVLPYHDEH